VRPWEAGKDAVPLQETPWTAFEFFTKIQAPFYAFHDRDIARRSDAGGVEQEFGQARRTREGAAEIDGREAALGHGDIFFPTHASMCGASTNPDAHVFAYAARR